MCRPSFAVVILMLVGCCALAACVSTDQHRQALANVNATLNERDKQLAALQADRARLARELDAARSSGKKETTALQSQVAATQEELEALRQQREAAEKRLAMFKAFTAKLQKMITAGDIKVYVRQGRMIVALRSSVLFPSGKADLSARGKRTLASVATTLKEFPDRQFLVAGHTDTVPIKSGEFPDNWQLSTARAVTVVRFLAEQGVAPKQIAAAGYGEHDPVRSNKTSKGRALNRRIELILVPNLAELPKIRGLVDEGT
jgi:chemotaxis protein MotB